MRILIVEPRGLTYELRNWNIWWPLFTLRH